MDPSRSRTSTHSIFLISVALGAVGIAISETYLDRTLGGLGFWVGFLLGYLSLVVIAVRQVPEPSESPQLAHESVTTVALKHGVERRVATNVSAPSVLTAPNSPE